MESWQRLDRASSEDASRVLHICCGSTRWVDRMLEQRPFGSRDRLMSAARDVWFALDRHDWLEAFSHHPRIGDRASLARRFPATHHLSSSEQAGVADADASVIDALGAANGAYLQKFGYIFIICATGLTAGEMLARLRERLANPPDVEIRVAAEEQARITALRLDSTASG